MVDRVKMAARIRYIQRKRGFNQQQLAEALQVSQPAVSQYLSGRIPPASVLWQLARIGETSIEWILSGQAPHTDTSSRVAESSSVYGSMADLAERLERLPTPIRSALETLLAYLPDDEK